MISVPELRTLAEAIKSNDEQIKYVVICVSEEHAYKKLADKPGPVLMILYPDVDRVGSQDEGIDQNATWLFFLEKGIQDATDQKEEDQYERLRQMTVKARDFIEDESTSCTFKYLARNQPGKSQIQSQNNEFGGFNGWGLSLVF